MDELRVLLRAREEIEKGWCKGRPFKDGGVCLWGAVMVGAGFARDARLNMFALRGVEPPAASRALDAISESGWGITLWNDAPETTKKDVLARIDRAINRVAAKAGVTDPAHTHQQAA